MVQVLILPLTSLSPFLDISIISPPSYVTNLNIFSVSLVFCFLNEQNISNYYCTQSPLQPTQVLFVLSKYVMFQFCFSFVMSFIWDGFYSSVVGGDVTGTQVSALQLTAIWQSYLYCMSHAMLQLVIPAICTLCTTLISSLSSGIA